MTKTDVALAKMLVDYAASRKLVLWSPSTDEFKVIPNGSIEHLILKASPPGTVLEELPIIPTFVAIHGFAYDPVTDEYKLIRRSGFSRDLYSNYENESFWQIYSLKSNCWRDQVQVEMSCNNNMATTVRYPLNFRGMCLWLGDEAFFGGEDVLISFNLSDETFIRTPLIHADDDSFVEHLVVLKESITLMEMDNYGGYLISILGELGIAESLTRLFRTGLLPGIREVIGVGKNGNIFFVTRDEEITRYNLNTEMIEEIGVRGRFGSCQMSKLGSLYYVYEKPSINQVKIEAYKLYAEDCKSKGITALTKLHEMGFQKAMEAFGEIVKERYFVKYLNDPTRKEDIENYLKQRILLLEYVGGNKTSETANFVVADTGKDLNETANFVYKFAHDVSEGDQNSKKAQTVIQPKQESE
ncbi:unnamed protein product [Trifolium pratense]|uniref:Uncharacterized protein n=1 Tax=Trifolium pratense TaxID=57577 RepID=A0ACB0IJ77_TRIPR|nr:unnamed protein product [Trifolium pratense]